MRAIGRDECSVTVRICTGRPPAWVMLGVSALPCVATEPRPTTLQCGGHDDDGDRVWIASRSCCRSGPRPGRAPPPGGSGRLKYNFGAGNPDPCSFPYQDLVQAMADVMETEGSPALSYGSFLGHEGLREWVCHKLKVFEDLDITPDNVLMTNGSGDAMGLVIQTFVDEGDTVISEAPTFSATLQTLRRNGADLYGVELDDEGMRTDLTGRPLERSPRKAGSCKMIYTIDNVPEPGRPDPHREAPPASCWSLPSKYNFIVLEDDAYGELRFEGEPVPSLFELDDAGLVARTGTLSKILGAGTRVGWVVAPPVDGAVHVGVQLRRRVSPLTSRICTYYMRGHLEPHVDELREIYKNKRDAMIETLETGLAGTDAAWYRARGRLLPLDQAADRHQPGDSSRSSRTSGRRVVAGHGLHAERRRRRVHPTGLQLRDARGDPRGHAAALQGDPGRPGLTGTHPTIPPGPARETGPGRAAGSPATIAHPPVESCGTRLARRRAVSYPRNALPASEVLRGDDTTVTLCRGRHTWAATGTNARSSPARARRHAAARRCASSPLRVSFLLGACARPTG